MYYSPSAHKGGASGFYFDEDANLPSDAFEVSDVDVATCVNGAAGSSYSFAAPNAGQAYGTLSFTPAPAPSPADRVNAAATAQISTLRQSFSSASVAPVTDSNGIQWSGGTQSASMLDGAVRIAQSSGASTVDLWDYTNTKHSLSLSEAQAVVDAVAGAFQTTYQKWQTLRAQVVAIQTTKTRATSTAYSAGDEVTDGNGNLWKCTTAGTSGSKKPTWPKSPTASSTVSDGAVTWTYASTLEAAIKGVGW